MCGECGSVCVWYVWKVWECMYMCVTRVESVGVGMNTSLERKNPKKHNEAATHSMALYPCLEAPFPTPLLYLAVTLGLLGA